MKIVLLVHSLRKGGAERVVLEIAEGLKNNGHNVNIITWINEDSFKYEYPNIERKYLLDKNNYLGLRSIPKSILLLRKAIRKYKPDIIHIHSPNIALLFSFSLIKIPAVHVIHGYGKIAKEEKNITSYILNYIDIITSLFTIRNFVVVSKSMELCAKDYFYFKFFNFFIIVNGIDINKFKYKDIDNNTNNINIIMIGTICQNKGQDHALKVIDILNNNNYKFNLTIVGDGPDLDKLKFLISESKFCNLIQIIPKADNINELLHESDILWVFSKSEAMPLVVLEAMASGVVVVGYNVRGVNDAIKNEVTGLLTEYMNYQKIAESTMYFVKNKFERKQFSKNARNYIESNFSLNTMVLEYEKLSKKILYG